MKKFLLMCFSFSFAIGLFAQDRVVTGKVTSKEDGTVLPGVNVVLKGSTTGTVTDADGSFTLSVPADGGTLVFSFIGLETLETVIAQRSVIDIQLGTDTKQLAEVVVTGSGVATDKKKLGIAVESITADKLPAAPTASIDQALVGKIAGAQISSISGNPGDPVQILLRGINTVQGGTSPMILVDGVQVAATDLNSLDLSNVDRVEVVQGSAASSIYGAQGAKGVIQIFSKKGKKGKLNINFSTSYASNQYINVDNRLGKASLHPYLTDSNNNLVDASNTPLTLDAYGNYPGISYEYGGPTRYAIINTQNVADKPYNANLKYYDHFKQVFQTGTTTNNAISISGSGDKTDFSVSVANNRTVSPVLKNGYVDRTNLSVNVGTEIFKGFTFRSTTQLVYTKNTMHPGLGAAGGNNYGYGNSQGNVSNIYGFLNTSPFFDLTTLGSDGKYQAHTQGGSFLGVNGLNPYFYQQYTDGIDNKTDIIQSFNANYKINRFVELDAKYGINYRDETATWTYYNQSQNVNASHWPTGNYTYAYYNNRSDKNGEIDYFHYTNTFQNFLGTAYVYTDFKNDFHSNLPIETSTQVSFDYRKRKYTEIGMYGTDLDINPPYNLVNAGTLSMIGPASYSAPFAPLGPTATGSYVEPFVTYGYLVNQKINYGDIGGITAGFRSDWSSAFGGGSTPFTFPHADGFISASSFWKNSSLQEILPYFKLRAAYGEAGIQPGAFNRIPVLSGGPIGNETSYSIRQVPNNPHLQVEVSKEFETGFDFTVNTNTGGNWFQTVNGSFTYWKRQSENVISPASRSLSTGAPSFLTNAIGMEGNGFQFSLNIPVYRSGNFTWDFTTNFGHQTSKITSISGGADIILGSAAGSTALVLTPGQIIGQIYGYKALRKIDDPEIVSSGNPASQYTMVDGRVVDLTTKQIQFSAIATPIGNPNPDFNTSFINQFGVKGFLTFSFQFDWVQGSHLYNQTKEWMYRDGIHSDFAKPVNINGEVGAFTAYWSSPYYNLFGSTSGAGNNATKDFFWEDASFVRLRNVSLGIDLAKFTNIKQLRKLQLVFTGRNLLTFTKYTGADPEVNSGAANSSFDRGVDHSTIPNLKSYQVGLNVSF
ncbi:MAG TPA: SusC/RagA family TonB-linked outer membrane protein [Cyclobacteriaceae bacterium]|jgi:TonB-linked SusC/RagA family outer membrane protein|nr:SusC/RagA family TonB-linked outer membrane protein [Cyclobacteriaceae bacterium]